MTLLYKLQQFAISDLLHEAAESLHQFNFFFSTDLFLHFIFLKNCNVTVLYAFQPARNNLYNKKPTVLISR